MAGDTVNISALSDILKEEFPFGSRIWKNFDEGSPTLDLLESGDAIPFLATHEGKYLKVPLHTGGNPNAAMPMGEEGQHTSSGRQSYDSATYNTAIHNQALRMTGLSMVVAPGGTKSVADALATEMAAQPRNARVRMSKFLHGDGSGIFASMATDQSAAAGTNQFVVDSTQDLEVGLEIVLRGKATGSLYTGAGVTYATGTTGALVISAINTTNNVVTVTDEDGATSTFDLNVGASGATFANFGVYPFDSQGETINGFGILCSNANPGTWGSATAFFGDIDRSTNTFWQAQQIDGSASGKSDIFNIEDHVQPMHDKLDEFSAELVDNENSGTKIGSGSPWICFLRYDSWNALANAMERDRRTTHQPGGSTTVTLKGGHVGIEYGPTVFVRDKHAPKTKARWYARGSAYRYIARDWYWDEMTGSMWRVVTSSAGRGNRDSLVYRAYMVTMQQVIAAFCRANGEVINLNASN